METPFLPEHFRRLDDSPDHLFYEMPRKVVHIDAAAIRAVTQFFAEVIPPAATVLDLLSSWRSHWPPTLPRRRLVGLGLNAEEMADNPDLDAYVVHDVNATPRLPFEEGEFDVVTITVSVQYLTQPVLTFREVRRILHTGGLFVIIFSNRMFPTKAVAVWRALNDQQHFELIHTYLQHAGGFMDITAWDRTPASTTYTDPVYVVTARAA